MAGLLRRSFPGRHVCYINGSQFGVLCYEDEIESGLELINDELEGYKADFSIFCKAGFAPYTGSERAISLMDKAKVAHDSIYEEQGANCRIYDTKLDEEDRFRQYIVSHVDEAIEKGYLKVYYQPIVRAVTGEVCNEEALSRWEDPKYGFLPPFQFVPLLEERRLIYKVNLNVLRLVLRDFETKRKNGVPIVPVSINFSRYDFAQCDMVQSVCDLVDGAKVPHSMIKIEITESALIDNQDLVKREIERFRQNGFEVWMDDFGSEYSTLNLLQELSFDLIKIDMQFMKNFSETGKNVIIVSKIIDLARQMGITTLVEGVETEEHYQILHRLGAEKLQGFLFNKPNPLEYIMDRAKSGTGLTFERPAESRYYEEVGRVNLNEPLVYEDKDSLFIDNELPAGVLEFRDGKFTCIRSKDRFVHLLSYLGLIPSFKKGSEHQDLVDPVPENLLHATERCTRVDGWVQFALGRGEEQEYTCYLRRVASNDINDSVALLAVLLTTQIN
jgi:EAL domain-containing protein (putative c-di-GMP-specific phosphodiesterase class I)